MFTFLVLLGIADHFFVASAVGACLLAFAALVRWLLLGDSYKPDAAELVGAMRQAKFMAVVAVVITSIACAIPSRRDLAESYALAEASTLATGDSVQKVVDEVLKRVDAVLGKQQ